MEIENQINDIIELKRLIIKLENELEKKTSEISILSKHNFDLKSLCQELQEECEELNKKLISKNSDLKKLEKKYNEEIENINKNFEKQKEIYESKILKLSATNPTHKEIIIERDIQIKYDEKIKEKNLEIEILKNKNNKLINENNELRIEIENIQKRKMQMMNLKEEKDFLNDLVKREDNENNNENENTNKLKNIQMILNEKDEKIEKLYKELDNIKNETKNYEINISKKYFFDLNQLKEMENKNNILNQKLFEKNEETKEIEKKLMNLEEFIEKSKKEKEEIIEENKNLLLKINDLENNNEIQNDLDKLKELVQKYESDQNNDNLYNQRIKQKSEERSKNKINELEKKLEEEKEKFSNYMESNNLKSNINYLNIMENSNVQQNDSIFKQEYEKIHQKYNLLLIEEKMRTSDLQQKEEENEMLNKNLRDAIKKGKQREEKYYKLKEKYKVLLNKKERYKELCKIVNKNMENVISLLNPEQKKSIENSGNKYLLDTDNFSLTEII